MSILKELCSCGHEKVTHYRDPVTGERWACTGTFCDCRLYRNDKERDTPLLPPSNYDERSTAVGGGRPHIECRCTACCQWDYEQVLRDLRGLR